MTTAQEVKAMKKEIADMKKVIANYAEGAVPNSDSRSFITRAEIQDLANKAGKSVRGFVSEKRTQVEDVTKQTQKTIKSRPLTSAAAALAGGMVLGALLRRK